MVIDFARALQSTLKPADNCYLSGINSARQSTLAPMPMSYLKFDRRLMANLDEALQREYIRTNRMGAYSCSSIVGCNTRKYHGLLVVPVPELSPHNHVLLSSLDLSIVQHDVPFNIGLHEYPGGVFSPKGHKYIREYNIDTAASITYRVGGVLLRRETYFCHYQHRIIIKFTLLEANSQTTLRLSPFLAFRDVKMLTHRNDHLNTTVTPRVSGISMCLYEDYPELFMQLSDASARFVEAPYWNEQIAYSKERERGYEYTEDLYVPGYFEVDIIKGQPLYFSAGLSEIAPDMLSEDFDEEAWVRIPRTDFRSCLLNAAQQFYYRPNPTDGFLLAGYPWFGVRARDLFVALPGCSIYADAPERYDRVMETMQPIIYDYIEQRGIDRRVEHLSDPDVGVWAIWCVQEYARWGGIDEARRRYGTLVKRIVDYYQSNRHPWVRMEEESALLYTYNYHGHPITWMDARLNGQAVVPRSGYLVELNALWYNALCFAQELLGEDATPTLSPLIERLRNAYHKTFVNQYGYLWDQVHHDGYKDWSVRPNMIFAISLPYTPLPRELQRSILEIVTRELRTPKGLRSLSPKSEGYKSVCTGSQYDREHAYYNGSAWPWLLGAYFEAYLRVYGHSGISFVERTLIGMEEELQIHGVGTISELFDGNPPYRGRGAISFAMSVGEILRSLYLLDKTEQEHRDGNRIIRYI